MLHYVYVGHFAHQGDFIQFAKQPDGSLRPVLERPLSLGAVEKVLNQSGLSVSSIPDDWGVWLNDGFIVCDAVTPNRAAIEMIRDLAQATGCDLADYSSQTRMTPEEYAWQRPLDLDKWRQQGVRVEGITADSTQH